MGIVVRVPIGADSNRKTYSLKLRSLKAGCRQSAIIPVIMIAKADAASTFERRELALRSDQTRMLVKARIGINQYLPPTPGSKRRGHCGPVLFTSGDERAAQKSRKAYRTKSRNSRGAFRNAYM